MMKPFDTKQVFMGRFCKVLFCIVEGSFNLPLWMQEAADKGSRNPSTLRNQQCTGNILRKNLRLSCASFIMCSVHSGSHGAVH